jgi:hypothetical protein
VTLRLRHLALVTSDLERVAIELQRELGLKTPFVDDPLAADWGVGNAVFALGDQFLEVMAPTRPGTAAGRHLERRGGDAGYMIMFQVDDVHRARARARAAGVRLVWQLDLLDMSGTHLHPADVPGAIVALDAARPPGSWRWAGPEWTGRAGRGAPGAILGATVSVPDPAAVARRWAQVLGEDPPGVRFLEGDAGLSEITVAVPGGVRAGRDAVTIGGVRFVLRPA